MTNNQRLFSGSGNTFRTILYFLLFFSICLGLGYPSVSRYTPGPPSLSDAQPYAEMTEVGIAAFSNQDHWHRRILVPLLAHPIYQVVNGHIGHRDARFFALLIVNALFCAGSATLLMHIGRAIFGDKNVGLISALLFLLNFNVSNLYLSGLVDSAETFLVISVIVSIYYNKWFILPLIGVLGPLSKETFIVYSTLISGGWWLGRIQKSNYHWSKFFWVAALALTSCISLIALIYILSDRMISPFSIAHNELAIHSISQLLSDAANILTTRSVWYTFIFLLPLSLPCLKEMPRQWVIATLVCLFGTVCLSLWAGAADNINRPLFTAIGPFLCLTAARTLVRFG